MKEENCKTKHRERKEAKRKSKERKKNRSEKEKDKRRENQWETGKKKKKTERIDRRNPNEPNWMRYGKMKGLQYREYIHLYKQSDIESQAKSLYWNERSQKEKQNYNKIYE